MKVIRRLEKPTPGLVTYLDCVGDDTDWDEFRSHGSGASYRDSGASYRELRAALADNQRGLCAYCEMTIRGRRHQIEHVIPRNALERGHAKALDIANMLACCMGGTAPNIGLEEDGEAEEDRYREPVRDNMSCGQAKGDREEEGFIDPRTLPVTPSLAKVMENGRIEVDEEACRIACFAPEHVALTIEVLNLNAERIRFAREKRWNDLVEVSEGIDDPEKMDVWVRSVLMPDEDGRLAPFFTTTRCYFHPLGERILAEDPHAWI